jgi:hypothetical protein
MRLTAEEKKQINEAAHIIHFHISERCQREDLHVPTLREVRDSVILALNKIVVYKNKFNVDTSNRDMIKYFSFSISLLIAEWDNEKRNSSSMRINGEIFYLSFFDFLASVYPNVDFSKHPDIPNTCRILKEMVISDNILSTYSYFKGISESCIMQIDSTIIENQKI